MGQYKDYSNRFFDDVRLFGKQTICDAGIAQEAQAEQIANEIAYRLSQHWGGTMFYVAKYSPWQAHERDLAIWRDFTGNNHHELAIKYHLSVPYIYEITARMRKLFCAKQQDLFD